MKSNGSNGFAWLLVGGLATACVVLWLWPKPEQEPEPKCDPTIDVQVDDEIMPLHKQRKWEEAIAAWDKLLATKICERQRIEAEAHRKVAEEELHAEQTGKASWSRTEDDTRGKPREPAPEGDFLRFYPEGRRIRSVAYFNTKGRGENSKWVAFKGSAHFAYQHRVTAETTVTENNGNRAVFQLYFPEVTQLCATSEQELELDFPDSPILELVWTQLDAKLELVPQYAVLRRIGKAINALDPHLKKTLTTFNGQLRRLGLPLSDDDHVELIARIERLSGHKLEITYVRDLGVVAIKILEGGFLSPDDFDRLAYNSSLLMDYFIFPVQDKRPGDQWTVRAEDVAGIITPSILNTDVKMNGELLIKRGQDRSFPGEQQATLETVDGSITGEFTTEGHTEKTTLKPEKGSQVFYSLDDRLIREARMKWDVSEVHISEGSLLFGTRGIRNASVSSYYEAERLE